MNNELPITIKPSIELSNKFPKLASVTNKLEAQFNFQTMTASWYGDETDILLIHCYLVEPEGFATILNTPSNSDIKRYADDVFTLFDKANNILACYLTFSVNEFDLLTKQPNILKKFCEIKLRKTLNLIAKSRSLTEI